MGIYTLYLFGLEILLVLDAVNKQHIYLSIVMFGWVLYKLVINFK